MQLRSRAEIKSANDYMKKVLLTAAASVWVIFVVALGSRLGFTWNQERKFPHEVLAVAMFSQETGSIALALATGKGFSTPFGKDTGPTAWLTPVYPSLVAGVFRIFGIFTRASFFAVVFLNALFSAAACVAIFHAGKRIAGPAVGSCAAWLWAIFPNAVMMPFEWVWDTSLSALLGATILWATLELPESRQLRDWCAYGILWGFTLMTNPALGSLLPFLLGWAAYRARNELKLRAFMPVLAAAGIAVLCCVPWTVRNYTVFHRLIPLRSNFALELHIGNNENYAPRAVWPPKITKERELVRYFHMDEMAFMDEERRKALDFMRAHPGIEVRLTAERFVAFWTGIWDPVQAFLSADSLLVRVLLVCSTAAALGGALGIAVLLWTRSPYAFPVAAFPVVYPWLYYVTHSNLRYRHPIDTVMLLLVPIAGRILANKSFTPSSPVIANEAADAATLKDLQPERKTTLPRRASPLL